MKSITCSEKSAIGERGERIDGRLRCLWTKFALRLSCSPRYY
jgi:hypothetical protein